jgi:hypothetical protein
MSVYYEIVTWDIEGFGMKDPVQRAETITDLALLYGNVADSMWAVEDGRRRELKAEEKLELRRETDHIAEMMRTR